MAAVELADPGVRGPGWLANDFGLAGTPRVFHECAHGAGDQFALALLRESAGHAVGSAHVSRLDRFGLADGVDRGRERDPGLGPGAVGGGRLWRAGAFAARAGAAEWLLSLKHQ